MPVDDRSTSTHLLAHVLSAVPLGLRDSLEHHDPRLEKAGLEEHSVPLARGHDTGIEWVPVRASTLKGTKPLSSCLRALVPSW